MKEVEIKKEISNFLIDSKYKDLLTVILCESTNYDVEEGKKIIDDMINKSIKDLEKKLASIDTIIQLGK